MNERTPPPKLENISAGIKFTTYPGEGIHSGRSRLVASLHVASSCWFVDREADKHPDVMKIMKEKLKVHLLRQLYANQLHEMHDAVNEFMQNWTPLRPLSTSPDPFTARDALMKLCYYSPPAGFGEIDEDWDCDLKENCGCEQFLFVLSPHPK